MKTVPSVQIIVNRFQKNHLRRKVGVSNKKLIEENNFNHLAIIGFSQIDCKKNQHDRIIATISLQLPAIITCFVLNFRFRAPFD